MVRVTFPRVLVRHVACPPVDVQATTVRQALDAAFAALPAVRGYVLDEHGQLRPHMTVFVDDEPVRDRGGLSDKVKSGTTVAVMQALSGG